MADNIFSTNGESLTDGNAFRPLEQSEPIKAGDKVARQFQTWKWDTVDSANAGKTPADFPGFVFSTPVNP